MLCRGTITIDRLHWDGNQVEAEMTSAKSQEITLVLPRGIADIKSEHATIATGTNANERKLLLPAAKKVTLTVLLK